MLGGTVNNRVLYVVAVVVMSIVIGCSSGYRAVYDIGLIDAERPEAAQQRYGQQIVKVVAEFGKEFSHFEDDLVAVAWTPTPHQFQMELTNKVNGPIEIVWDDGAFVDENGTRHRIVTSQVIYEDRDKPQQPTVIAAGGTISESIRSADNIFYEKGITARYREKPFFPTSASSKKELDEKAASLEKKIVKVALPLQVEGQELVYVFAFQLANVDVVKGSGKKGTENTSVWIDEETFVPAN